MREVEVVDRVLSGCGDGFLGDAASGDIGAMVEGIHAYQLAQKEIDELREQ